MAVAEPYVPPRIGTLRGRSMVRVRRRRRSRAAVIDRVAISLLLLVTLMAVFTPLIAPYKPNLIAGDAFIAPGRQFLLGTDEVGRDIFSRVLYGLRTSWFASLGRDRLRSAHRGDHRPGRREPPGAGSTTS